MEKIEQIENSLVEQVSLIDILYKDEYRVDSYVAQIMHGLLKRRKFQETDSNVAVRKLSGSIKVISGDLSQNTQETAMEELNFIPHDDNIITLLNALDLSPVDILGDSVVVGRLVWMKCRLAVRDFRKFTSFFSAITENPEIFGVKKNESNAWQKKFKAIAKIVPLNIEIECFLKDNSVVRGILKENYLLTAYQDIVAMFGAKLPGKWNVVGILDSLNSSNIPNNVGNSFRS